ncbi:CDP-2,3-bis-(O-geranylgeranyl)-sn-glycerol synthase [Methanobacterium alcaliphilum]|uniref:CDP-2,3-bis-(O-geranylgeranyl)-sn-glycerol synthase n=1 Tax=Methanobacterium alcaliphilum TaxID=392018 RepID=UPI00200AB1E1|nr:CDP-2,3-bis-(O-geranylgeranyl)-sn-glycerol synthase [Methanobacterium alcaliphilum]MCK9150900.1 CDP-2,3-bis-(O-geranylgeranyl)-sn-glycerol synthase [Methanobacterium alcaliphilum]
MNPDIINVLTLIAYVIYFMLPAYLANVSALTFGGGTPVDFGREFRDGRRILGDGVTWKGTIIGTAIGTLIGLLQGIVIGDVIHGTLLGFCLGGGALLGDAAGSFLKRRLKIDRGRPAPILDQLDFVVGALILASLVMSPSPVLIITALIISPILHLSANIISYLMGMKNVWY